MPVLTTATTHTSALFEMSAGRGIALDCLFPVAFVVDTSSDRPPSVGDTIHKPMTLTATPIILIHALPPLQCGGGVQPAPMGLRKRFLIYELPQGVHLLSVELVLPAR